MGTSTYLINRVGSETCLINSKKSLIKKSGHINKMGSVHVHDTSISLIKEWVVHEFD